MDRVFGASLWYDGDGTHGDDYFQQVGLSLETLGKWIDFRTNFYLPVGQTTQQSSASLVSGSAQYVGERSDLQPAQHGHLAAMHDASTWRSGSRSPASSARRPRDPRLWRMVRLRRRQRRPHSRRVSSRPGEHRLRARCVGVRSRTTTIFRYARACFSVSWTFGPLHLSNLSQDNAKGRIGERVTRNYTVLVIAGKPDRQRRR